MVKRTEIGCSCVMTTRPFASPARTMFPASSRRRPRRRGDACVGELQLGVVDLTLVELDRAFVLADQGLLRVHLLLCDRVLCVQRPVALDVDACIREQRLVARHLAFELRELRLVGARVDLGKEISLLHHLPFPEQYPHQLAVHPAAHGHRLERRHRAQAVQVDVDVAGPCRRGDDRSRAIGVEAAPAGRALLRVTRLQQVYREPRRGEEQHGDDHPGAAPRAPRARKIAHRQGFDFHFSDVARTGRFARPGPSRPEKCKPSIAPHPHLQQDITAARGNGLWIPAAR